MGLDLLDEFLDASEAELLGRGEDFGESEEGGSEGGEIAGSGEVCATAGHKSFDVTEPAKGVAQVATMDGGSEEAGDGVVPSFDLLGVEEWLFDPAAEEPCAHWGAGLIEDSEEGESTRAIGEVLGEFEGATGGWVEPHEAFDGVGCESLEVTEVELVSLGVGDDH